VKNAILDGEVLALDKTGQPQFTDLLTGPTALAYTAFDLLWLNGRDLRPLLLSKRKAELAKVIPAPGAHVFKVLSADERGWDLFEAVQRTDFEGIVAKRKSDPTVREPFGSRSRIHHIRKHQGTASNGADKQRVREPVERDGGKLFAKLLDAEPVKPKGQRAATSFSNRGLPRNGAKFGSILSQPGER
jgi:hypothetical protein